MKDLIMPEYLTDEIPPASPFDAMKQARTDGSEFWSARDLCATMGYSTWQKFENPLNRAMTTAANQGHDVDNLFTRSVKVSGQRGPASADFEMSRFAAYLVAMNGDPNMPEVAAAQAYFAIQTRVAETTRPVRELTFEEKMLEVMGTLQEKVSTQLRELEQAKPLIARAKTYEVHAKSIARQPFAREVCRWAREQKGIEVKQADVMAFLSKKLHLFVAGSRADGGQATAEAEKRGYAETAKGTHENGHNYATGKLTAAGQSWAWKRITEYIEDNGTLVLPKEVKNVA